jgi:hypothetical protein
MPTPITVFTNVFTLKGKRPEENEYIKIFIVWIVLLKKLGALGPDDTIFVAFDSATLEYIKEHPKFGPILFTHANVITQYPTPATIIDGMKMRYKVAHHLQQERPGNIYMYLDVDVLVVRPIRDAFPCEEDNKLFITTEEFLKNLVGDIFHTFYLDNRLELTEEERTRVSQFGGISSGIFAWRFSSMMGEMVFKRICAEIEKDIESGKEFQHTIDQPYFNEQAIRLFLLNSHFVTRFRQDSVGFNCPVGYNPNNVFINYAGHVGDGKFHFEKIQDIYEQLCI